MPTPDEIAHHQLAGSRVFFLLLSIQMFCDNIWLFSPAFVHLALSPSTLFVNWLSLRAPFLVY